MYLYKRTKRRQRLFCVGEPTYTNTTNPTTTLRIVLENAFRDQAYEYLQTTHNQKQIKPQINSTLLLLPATVPTRQRERRRNYEASNCKIAALIARLLAVFRELGIDGGFPFRCFAKRVLFLQC